MENNNRYRVEDDMIEIEALDRDSFLKVRETLTRMGVLSTRDGERTLTQTCHVLKKRGCYYICHFKQLFLLDGKFATTEYTEIDDQRLVKTANLLRDWGLVKLITDTSESAESHITVVPFREKDDFTLRCNYRIGRAANGTTQENN